MTEESKAEPKIEKIPFFVEKPLITYTDFRYQDTRIAIPRMQVVNIFLAMVEPGLGQSKPLCLATARILKEYANLIKDGADCCKKHSRAGLEQVEIYTDAFGNKLVSTTAPWYGTEIPYPDDTFD